MLTRERIRFVRFCVVGATGVVVNLGVFSLFMYPLLPDLVPEEPLRFVVSNCFGFVTSVFTNFLLNDYWTWGDREKRGHAHLFARLGKFYVVSSVAGIVQIGLAYGVRQWFGLHDYLAVLIGIGAATIINFVANHLWTFREPKPER